MEINKKYQPLFMHQPGVRYYVVTGGRGSAKSFTVATAINVCTYDDKYNILYTRYSMVSADISVIPEFTEKMSICNNADDFAEKSAEIRNKVTGAMIYFRGILQSRKNQDARLKSVPNVKLWVLDEAQELTDESTFDTIDLSIRTTGANNEVWLIMNPTDVNHWIYQRFFKGPGVEDDFNGIVGDTCYIHTTYLENMDHLDSTFLAQAEKMKVSDPEKYKNIFLGHWKRFREGLIYKNWTRDRRSEEMTRRGDCWYGIDWGFTNDPTAIVRLWYDSDSGILWVWQVKYQRGMLIGQIAVSIREDLQICQNPGALLYCDPARPEHIAELRRVYNLNACPANNKDKPGRVDWLKGCNIHFDGDDIDEERDLYSYLPSKIDPREFSNIPQDGNDHAMDAINYGAVSHLRRQGIANALGEM